MEVEEFGHTDAGEVVHKLTIHSNSLKVQLTNYGASLIGLWCPDKHGTIDDILLGFDTLKQYLENPYFGSTIGRCANRIAKGKFSLDGETYTLACNNGNNHLHGGEQGFDRKVWSWKEVENGVEFELVSKDGDEGYPGTLHVSVSYILTDNQLQILFSAQTQDKPTVVNLTNHAFINLRGQRSTDNLVLDHMLYINSHQYLPHENGIPVGIADANDAFDFSKSKRVGDDIESVDGGYDHNYCLKDGDGDGGCSARLEHPESGRVLEIITDQPGLQFYSGNYLDVEGKNGSKYVARSGLCLEPQNYPNSVNEESFPCSILLPGELYKKHIIWKVFSKNQ